MTKMKDSGVKWIGQIPEDWRVVRVKDVFYRSQEKAKQEDPVILSLARSGVKVRDITSNEGQVAASYFDYNPVKKGDLLLNPMDLYSGANCNYSRVEGVISPAYVNLRPKNSKVDSRFYDYYFKCQYWAMTFFAHGKGVSFDNRWTLNNETLMNYFIPQATHEKQKKIADFLDKKCGEIDELIAIQEKEIEKLKEYKTSVITKAVTKGLDDSVPMKDSGIDWIGKIPAHWNIIQTKRITKNHLQGYYDSDGYSDVGYRLLRITDLEEDGKLSVNNAPFVKESKGIQNFLLTKGDFCFARTGGAGLFGFVSDDLEPSVFASYLIRFRFINQHNEFLKYIFLSYGFQKEIDSLIHGAVNRNVHAENILETHIALPPVDEQILITKHLDKKCVAINNLILQKQQKIEKLQEYKKSLIYEYVTGKKEVI